MKDKKVLDFFITSLNGMAHGLFATLIVGTILGTAEQLCGIAGPSHVLQSMTGAGIGAGIALALKFDPLKTIVLSAAGELAAYFSLSTKFVTEGTLSDAMKTGDPLTIYLVCICVALVMKLVLRRKTAADTLIVPLFGVIAGYLLSLALRYPSIYVTYGVQYLVNAGTNASPFFMGIIVSVVMGMALTAPISSAAIAAMIFTLPQGVDAAAALAAPEYSGLLTASGAAVVGCSTQMLGFAIQARKDVSAGMVLSIAIGTSMLEFQNVLRKPVIWLPVIMASAILGPVATCAAHLYCAGSAAGMGTAGLVGQIGTIASTGSSADVLLSIALLEIIAPCVLVFGIDLLFRRLGLIKPGDLAVSQFD